ncbi:hypothetical protein ACGFZS_37940 [Streptomyces sp. NPDC048288]|uniref:hypothetical protein n=1 Tax=Streptomyces sp. NPDC048288 TaxID=3365529 RepID=UPI003720F064
MGRTVPPALDQVLWQAWKAMELPEGYRAEIIEGAIEVSPTRRYSHGQIVFMLREALAEFLKDGDFAARGGAAPMSVTPCTSRNPTWRPVACRSS